MPAVLSQNDARGGGISAAPEAGFWDHSPSFAAVVGGEGAARTRLENNARPPSDSRAFGVVASISTAGQRCGCGVRFTPLRLSEHLRAMGNTEKPPNPTRKTDKRDEKWTKPPRK